MDGLPENVNPFCVNREVTINDGVLSGRFPDYFSEENFCTFAIPSVETGQLSQSEAEELVREISKEIVLEGEFAVKESFARIIPQDLRNKIPVTTSNRPTCASSECYYLS